MAQKCGGFVGTSLLPADQACKTTIDRPLRGELKEWRGPLQKSVSSGGVVAQAPRIRPQAEGQGKRRNRFGFRVREQSRKAGRKLREVFGVGRILGLACLALLDQEIQKAEAPETRGAEHRALPVRRGSR